VLDTHLRTPAACRLVQQNDRAVWLASAANRPEDRQAALTRAGAVCLPCSLNNTGRIDLHALLKKLHDRGVHSLMVEGGAQVITSFIRAGLADLFIITVSPAFVGGLQAVDGRSTAPLSKLAVNGHQLRAHGGRSDRLGQTRQRQKMNQYRLIFEKPRRTTIERRTVPQPEENELLVANRLSAISAGTEMLIFGGHFPEQMAVDTKIASLSGAFSISSRLWLQQCR
jgi:hypothetical protein